VPNDANQGLLEIRKPPSLQNKIDLKHLGTSVSTTISTFRHLYAFCKHSLQTLTQYGGCDNNLHATRNGSVTRVAAIYLTVIYSAEDFYKHVASLYICKGLSPIS